MEFSVELLMMRVEIKAEFHDMSYVICVGEAAMTLPFPNLTERS
jgi:hypothetical protein